MSVLRIDSVHFYISNLPCVQFLFCNGLNFKKKPYKIIDKNVSIISQNDIKIILNSSDDSLSDLSKQVALSGDFIKDIVFEVENIEEIIDNAKTWGASIIDPIQEIRYEHETFKKATIAAFGNTNHSLIQKTSCYNPVLALSEEKNNARYLEKIDHIAVAVESKNLQKWVDFYEKIFGLKKIFEENIVTENSGMMSVVVGDDEKGVKIVLVSPVDGKSRSQINDFIINNKGEGVQHIAFSARDIVESIKNIKNKGIEFLDTNDDYYKNLDLSASYDDSFKEKLKHYKILYDKDEYGELLQIFSKTLHTKPTWFIEIIERRGARTFGRGNIKKLYESVEKELSIQRYV